MIIMRPPGALNELLLCGEPLGQAEKVVPPLGCVGGRRFGMRGRTAMRGLALRLLFSQVHPCSLSLVCFIRMLLHIAASPPSCIPLYAACCCHWLRQYTLGRGMKRWAL